MNRIIRCLFAFMAGGAIAAICAPAFAQQVPIAPGQKLTLNQAIQIALALHPRVLESQSRLQATRETVGEAESHMLPQAYGVGEYLRSTDNGIGDTNYIGMLDFPRLPGRDQDLPVSAGFPFSWSTQNNFLTGVSISQFLFDFGRVRGLINQARFNTEAAHARLDLTRLDIIYQVSEAYFALLAAKQMVRVYTQAVVERKEQLHEADVMAKVDLKPRIDVYIQKAQLSRSQLKLLDANNAQADAKVALDNAMGLSESAPAYRQATRLSYQATGDSRHGLLLQAMQFRPDLKMLRDEAAAAGAEVRIRRSDYFPTFRATGGYTAMGTGLPAANNFDVGVVVTWPIFNGMLTTHQLAEARYRREALKHAIENLHQRIVEQVTRSFLDWQSSLAEIVRAKAALDASEQELHLAEQRYRTGLSSIVELVEAQTHETTDDAAYVNALYRYAVAGAAVDRASGRSLSRL